MSAPQSLEETGIDFSALVDLCVKSIYFFGRPTARQIVSRIALPFPIVGDLLVFLKQEQIVEVVGSAGVGEQLYQYSLTKRGLEKAEEALARNHYVGPAPVPFAGYIEIVRKQSVRNVTVDSSVVAESLKHLVLDPRILASLGPAINSGRSVLIYGNPGNGKTAVTSALRHMLPGDVLIPHAIDIGGNIVKLFDPRIHEERAIEPAVDQRTGARPPDGVLQGGERRRDRRWVLCRRPMVSAGGELTLADLELRYASISKFYVAPLQVKAMNGVLVVDDFGRQIVHPKELLNRWIVPMENAIDHLSLHTGETIEIPFDLLLVFSTNIPPNKLGDEAFFRRIRYKVEVPDPTREQFVQILQHSCSDQKVPVEDGVVQYLVERYYQDDDRAFRGCHPRDLVELLIDICRYHGVKPILTREWLDVACASYFVQSDSELRAA